MANRGWRLVGSDPDLARRWRQVFGLKADCRVSHLIAGGVDGRQAASFELGDGYGWRGYRWHVVTMSLPVPLPTLQLTPEVRRGRMVGALGGQDLTFESAQFNEVWRVQSKDAKTAHDVLHPRLLERLMEPDVRALSLRIDGSDVVCWRWGPAFLGQVEWRLGLLKDVVDAIPRFVWLEHGYDPGFGPAAAPSPPREPAPLGTRRERFAQWWAVSVSSGATRRRRGRPLRRRRRRSTGPSAS